MKKKILLFTVIVLIIAILFALYVFCLKNNYNNMSNNEIINLDVESEEVQSAYNKLLQYNKLGADIGNVFNEDKLETIDTSFYKDKKMTLSELSDADKMIAVLSNVKENDIKKDYFSNLTNTISYAKLWYEQFEEDREVEIYTKDVLEKAEKEVFGQDIDIEYKTLDLCGTTMEYIDGNYYKYDYEGGGLGYTETGYSKLIKAEKDKDKIYLYDKFLYCDEEEFFAMNGELKLYKTSDKTSKIDFEINFDDYDIQSKVDKIFSYFGNQLNTYKHTFKEDKDGQYYWVSTEIVEEGQKENPKSNLLGEIAKVSVSLFYEDDGIAYSDPMEIKDIIEIKEILNIIDSATPYPDDEFERNYGIGGFFEGCPLIELFDINGKKITVVPFDDFDENLNIFYITESEDYSEKYLYKADSKLGDKVLELTKKVDKNLENFLGYVAFLNQAEDNQNWEVSKTSIELEIASYYLQYEYTDEGFIAYKRDELVTAMKEMFNKKLSNEEIGACGLVYDSEIDSFCYEAGGDGYCSSYVVKIEDYKIIDGLNNITLVYSYPNEGDFLDNNIDNCSCYKTTIIFKENEEYKYCKYQLINEKEMTSSYVGKIKDFK